MYFAEYDFHMYAGYLTGWAHKKNIPLISDLAQSAHDAEITVGEWDLAGLLMLE